MLKRFLPTVRNATILLEMGGPKVFLATLWRQVYCKDRQIGMERNLETGDIPPVESKIKYYLQLASESDMKEAFEKAKNESRDSIQILLYMKWLYECGFRKWYVARTVDTHELCFMDLVICPEENGLIERHFKSWFPRLKDNEVLLEGAYTFEKYRGQGLTASAHIDIINLFREKGFKRIILYMKKDNFSSFKLASRVGFKQFEEVPVHKILFFNRKSFNRFNTPGLVKPR